MQTRGTGGRTHSVCSNLQRKVPHISPHTGLRQSPSALNQGLCRCAYTKLMFRPAFHRNLGLWHMHKYSPFSTFFLAECSEKDKAGLLNVQENTIFLHIFLSVSPPSHFWAPFEPTQVWQIGLRMHFLSAPPLPSPRSAWSSGGCRSPGKSLEPCILAASPILRLTRPPIATQIEGACGSPRPLPKPISLALFILQARTDSEQMKDTNVFANEGIKVCLSKHFCSACKEGQG